MPLSYRNIINVNAIKDAITSGDFSNESLSKKVRKQDKDTTAAKYIKGYANDTAIEALANALDINKGTFKQAFGLENKEIDNYDPYHTSDAKRELFWYSKNSNGEDSDSKLDGKAFQLEYDKDTNTFKRALYSNPELGGYRQNDFWYEDPFIPSFELLFDDQSPLFNGDNNISSVGKQNSLKYFIQKYGITSLDLNNPGFIINNLSIDDTYLKRFEMWVEFKKIFFKIFEKELKEGESNTANKSYYITKIEGLNNLNKKIINFPEDKITITLNEDVSMIAWYLSELYNNIIYSYKNQRYMFPENLIRFDLTIKINDMRLFQMPKSKNNNSNTVPVNSEYIDNKDIKNVISPKSQIIYTLHDCTFDFFESRNYEDVLEIGGYGAGAANTPSKLSFNIFYKSVTRSSKFPLIDRSVSINGWEPSLYTKSENENEGTKQNYYDNLDRISQQKTPEKKNYLNQLLAKGAQTIVNQGANYLDNLETKLREVRGGAVNNLLTQFRTLTSINKIEPDNVYAPDFNNRISLTNFGKQVASSLLNDLEEAARNAANF